MKPSRVLHGFKLAPQSRAGDFRLEQSAGTPTGIELPGRLWYDTLEESILYSKTAGGVLIPERLLDSEPKWRDLTAPISPGSGVGVSTPSWESFRGDFSAMLFLSNKVQSVQVCFHMDHDYAMGTDIFPHVHWMPKDANETGTVRWGVDILLAQGHQQDSFDGPIDTLYIEQSADVGIQHPHMVAESTIGHYDPRLEPDTLIYCRIFRDSGHPNDTAGDVFGLTMDMHIQIDDIGTPSRLPNFYARS